MRIRTKKLLSLLITAAMVFNMGSVSFAEDHTGDGYDGYDTEFEIDEKSTVTAESGWVCENADDSKATVTMSISPNWTYSNILSHDYYEKQTIIVANNIDLRYSGTMNSGAIRIVLDSSKKLSVMDPASCKIVVSVSRGDLSGQISDNNTDSGPLEVEIGRVEGKGIPESCVSFDLEEGLSVKKDPKSGEFARYLISYDMDFNRPVLSVKKQVGDYTITYYTKIPYFGKGKTAGSYTIGDVLISDNKTDKTYKVVFCNVIRLKNAKSGQGPFPTVSNAGMQIKKISVVESKTEEKGETTYKTRSKLDKEEKKVLKELKKLTKVNKKNGYESQALPVIIYPRRVTDGALRIGSIQLVIKGKPGKYSVKAMTVHKNGRKTALFNIKNGGKDSFKTGKHKVEYDKGKCILTIDSADAWTGPKGLSANFIHTSDCLDKTKE